LHLQIVTAAIGQMRITTRSHGTALFLSPNQ